MKTNSSAKKRFSLTGTGKIKRNKAYASHLLTHKSTKRKRHLRGSDIISKADEGRVKAMLCIGK